MSSDMPGSAIPRWLTHRAQGFAAGLPAGVAAYLWTNDAVGIAAVAVAIAILSLAVQVRGDLRAIRE